MSFGYLVFARGRSTGTKWQDVKLLQNLLSKDEYKHVGQPPHGWPSDRVALNAALKTLAKKPWQLRAEWLEMGETALIELRRKGALAATLRVRVSPEQETEVWSDANPAEALRIGEALAKAYDERRSRPDNAWWVEWLRRLALGSNGVMVRRGGALYWAPELSSALIDFAELARELGVFRVSFVPLEGTGGLEVARDAVLDRAADGTEELMAGVAGRVRPWNMKRVNRMAVELEAWMNVVEGLSLGVGVDAVWMHALDVARDVQRQAREIQARARPRGHVTRALPLPAELADVQLTALEGKKS